MRFLIIPSLLMGALMSACGGDESGNNGDAQVPPLTAPARTQIPQPEVKAKPDLSNNTSLTETPKAPAATALPKVEDVLPKGEWSKGSLLVTGEGYRFQVRPGYKRIDHPKSKTASRALLKF